MRGPEAGGEGLGGRQQLVLAAVVWGAGQATTLRTMSPHAPLVVIRWRFRPPISVRRSCLATKWNWMPWRVVTRRVPSPSSPAAASRASHWSALSTPPGTLVRTMHE